MVIIGSFAFDVAGYTGNVTYNCSATNTPNLGSSCTPITYPVSINGISNTFQYPLELLL